ncbi:MAG: Na+/H+ antiporter subunit D [Candidatus Hydrogenedens sp.]|nr:Na+/H+ antiporter subunit D [Candidatus Hydrogenedens sp.]
MNRLVILPIIIPLLTACLCLISIKQYRIQWFFAWVGNAFYFVTALIFLYFTSHGEIFSLQVGNWQAPFGITIIIDLFSSIMIVLTSILLFCSLLYTLSITAKEEFRFAYLPLIYFLIMGVTGAFITGDLFNLYVWYEVMLMSSFVLMAFGGEQKQLEGSIKYVILNLISSAIFLASTGILYGMVGTVNLADLSIKFSMIEHKYPKQIVGSLLLIAFGIKAGIFPLYFWLPASYHTPPAGISALFSGLLTKVGMYSIIRVSTLLYKEIDTPTQNILLIIASATMLVGVLGAVSQNEFRRILSFHIISQIGYMLMGLAFWTVSGISGAIYFMVHNIVAKSNLFFISGIAYQKTGTYQIKSQGGLYKDTPFLSLCFFCSALSLAGLPPLSGFVGKLALIISGIHTKAFLTVIISIIVSFLTLFSMTKIWMYTFWGKPNHNREQQQMRQNLSFAYGAIFILAMLTILLGVGGEHFITLTEQSAHKLINPISYIEKVMEY